MSVPFSATTLQSFTRPLTTDTPRCLAILFLDSSIRVLWPSGYGVTFRFPSQSVMGNLASSNLVSANNFFGGFVDTTISATKFPTNVIYIARVQRYNSVPHHAIELEYK